MTGGTLVGTFQDGESVEIVDVTTLRVYFRGWFGYLVGATMTLAKRDGSFIAGANIRVRGKISGAEWTPATEVDTSATRAINRWRVMLDYADFRAF
jgi:hypothetical protein